MPHHRATVIPLTVMGLLLCANSVFAQHMNAKDAPCNKPSTGAEETACFVAEDRKADLKLNQLYQRTMRSLDNDGRDALQQAQRIWIQFRDANCSAEEGLYRGGSAASMVKYACLEAMTRHRTEELQTMYGWRLEKFGK
jgi:uncharacterized protein YecT (DUF1311 family)